MSLVWKPGFTQWDPASITTALWLDAADNSTVFSDAGTTQAVAGTSTVQQWNDKSGNARHFSQSNPVLRPAYTTNAQNGRSAIAFDGSDDVLTRAVYTYNYPFTLFCVFKFSDRSTITATGSERAILSGAGNTALGAGGHWTNGFSNERIWLSNGTLGIAKTNADVDTTTPVLVGFSVPSTTLSLATGRLNGATDFATTNGAATMSSISNIGNYAAVNSAYFPGLIYEILILTSAESVFSMQRIEGYLAHKWGLTANLPSDHPYKVNPPAP